MLLAEDYIVKPPFGHVMDGVLIPPVLDAVSGLHVVYDRGFLGFAQGNDQENLKAFREMKRLLEHLFVDGADHAPGQAAFPGPQEQALGRDPHVDAEALGNIPIAHHDDIG